MMNRVSGDLSEREARRIQLLKYEQDQKEHAAKEKLKLEKKKSEKWKRYSHISMGEKLPNIGQHEHATRNAQQSVNDDKVINYILKLERENARLRAEEEKLKKSSLSVTCSGTISNVNHNKMQSPCQPVERIPFEANSVTNSPALGFSNASSSPGQSVKVFSGENSLNIQVPKSLTPLTTNLSVVCDSSTTQNKAELEKIKQESFKREMQDARERMQKLYSQHLNKED